MSMNVLEKTKGVCKYAIHSSKWVIKCIGNNTRMAEQR